MANSYPLAVKYSTEQIIAKAYKEYCTTAAENYRRLIDMVDMAVTWESTQRYSVSYVESAVNSILAEYSAYEYGYDSNVNLSYGVVKLGELLKSIVSVSVMNDQYIDDGLDVSINPEVTLPIIDIGEVTVPISDLCEELNANLHAIVTEEAVALSYTMSSNPVERVAMIRDKISDMFSSAYTDISNTLSYALDKVRSGLSIGEFISSSMQDSGINDGAEEGVPIGKSSANQFTGASPASAQSWSSAANKALQTGVKAVSTVCKVVKTAISGLLSWVGKLIKGVFNKIYTATVDPKDLEVINKDGTFTVKDFYYQERISLSYIDHKPLLDRLDKGPIHCDFIPCEFLIRKDGQIEPRIQSTIKEAFRWALQIRAEGYILPPDYDEMSILDFVNGVLVSPVSSTIAEAVYNVTGVTPIDNESSILQTLNDYIYNNHQVRIYVMTKYKCVNPKYSKININSTYGDLVDSLDVIKTLDALTEAEDPYIDIEANEKQLYAGFLFGAVLTGLLRSLLYYESTGEDMTQSHSLTCEMNLYTDGAAIFDPETYYDNRIISNYHFFILLTKKKFMKVAADDSCIEDDLGNDAYSIWIPLSNIFWFRYENPFDYPFWPYSQDYADWFDSRYRLIPDSEHVEAFENFVSTALVVIAVAAIAIFVGTKIKRYVQKLNVKREAAYWNAVQEGQKGKVSEASMKALRKATTKCKIASFLTGNLLTGVGAVSSSIVDNLPTDNPTNADVNLTPIISLIRG